MKQLDPVLAFYYGSNSIILTPFFFAYLLTESITLYYLLSLKNARYVSSKMKLCSCASFLSTTTLILSCCLFAIAHLTQDSHLFCELYVRISNRPLEALGWWLQKWLKVSKTISYFISNTAGHYLDAHVHHCCLTSAFFGTGFPTPCLALSVSLLEHGGLKQGLPHAMVQQFT